MDPTSTVGVVLLFLMLSGPLMAQGDLRAKQRSDSLAGLPVPALLHYMRTAPLGGRSGIISLLRQEHVALPMAIINELLDSLEAIGDIGTIGIAGSQRYPGGSPLPGTLPRLIRLGERHPTGGGAMNYMLELSNRAPALAYIRRIATSDAPLSDYHPVAAIVALMEDAAPRTQLPGTAAERVESLALLRELWDRRSVKHKHAASTLWAFATQRGW